MDINKCLLITVKEKGNNNNNKIEIEYNNEISDEEIERLIEKGEKNEKNDKKVHLILFEKHSKHIF